MAHDLVNLRLKYMNSGFRKCVGQCSSVFSIGNLTSFPERNSISQPHTNRKHRYEYSKLLMQNVKCLSFECMKHFCDLWHHVRCLVGVSFLSLIKWKQYRVGMISRCCIRFSSSAELTTLRPENDDMNRKPGNRHRVILNIFCGWAKQNFMIGIGSSTILYQIN